MSAIRREHLLTGAIGAHIDRTEVHRIVLAPAQQTRRHIHRGGVIGYVVDGAIMLEVAGRPATTLRRGRAFFEPPGATIARFDNASTTESATFVAFYPLAGDQALIDMMDQ